MDMRLVRSAETPNGVFGTLYMSDGLPLCITLEHSFDGVPALADGVYQCVRGLHTLAGHPDAFMTFEVTGVPGHTGILIHRGNFNADSHGCILLGMTSDTARLYSSAVAFEKFMMIQGDASSFTLTVSSSSSSI